MTTLPPALTLQTRSRALQEMAGSPLDVLIIGGGINGAGLVRDLALRAHQKEMPLRVGLVEQGYFSSGTSGKNSQLIHGGLRYLKNMEFALVREALHERATLLRIAPHLVEPLAFLIPFANVLQQAWYATGLTMYDVLAGKQRLGWHKHLKGRELRAAEPGLNPRLTSAAVFYDCRVHSARLVIANIAEAARHGAFIANYTGAETWSREASGLWRVTLKDRLTGDAVTVHAKALVDATGAWSRGATLRLVRGSHLIYPRLLAGDRAVAHFHRDGRIIFFIPWGAGQHCTLVGTTDVDHEGDAQTVRISPEETAYLQAILGEVFPAQRNLEPITSYSSLRPLVKDSAASATKTSRGHRIAKAADGMWSISGGKYTTYRAMSEEAADGVLADLGSALATTHLTAVTPIEGNSVEAVKAARESVAVLALEHQLTAAEVEELVRLYGTQVAAVLSYLPLQAGALLSRVECAQIAYAVRHEMVHSVSDVLYECTYWGYERRWDEPAKEAVASEMARWKQSTARMAG